MKIGLFASGKVGYAIADFFGRSGEPLSFLVVDKKDPQHWNMQIITNSKISTANVYIIGRNPSDDVISALRLLNVDLIILAWWPYILKEPLISLSRLGCLNFHPSLLPYNRGKHYNFWNLVEDVPFGVTIHFVNSGVDTGDIAFQSVIPKSWEDTGKTLYDKAQSEIVRLFIDNFHVIKSGTIPSLSQDLQHGSFHKAAELEPASQIFLDREYRARDMLNLLRARTFPPHPGAWFFDDGERYQIRIEITKVPNENR